MAKHAEDFDFGETLGKGAFGDVVVATDKETGKKYAVKILEKAQIIRLNKNKYVLSERDILFKAKHPNITRIYYTFRSAESLHFVIELCPHGDLKEQVKKYGTLDIESTKFYYAELVLALEFLRSIHVAHRDMKLENILLGDGWHLKLSDFGTAKILSQDEPETKETPQKAPRKCSFVGTADYVSPEMLESKDVDTRCDLWGMGVMLYVQLTGRLPFRGRSDMLTFENIQNRKLEFPKTGLDENARDLIDRLLQINPDDRIGSTDFSEIKQHPFFAGIEWETLNEQTPPQIKAGAVPTWNEDIDEIAYTFLVPPKQEDSEDEDDLPEIERSETPSKEPDDAAVETMLSTVLRENEKVIVSGMVTKKRKLSVKRRLLVLTTLPRFVYMDIKTSKMKGQIELDETTDIKVLRSGMFDIITPGRTFHFTDLSKNTDRWVTGLRTARECLPKKIVAE